MTNMKSNQSEPLNFKLAKITPKWVFKQSARRMLVVLLAVSPFIAGILISSIPSPYNLFCIPLLLVPIICYAWLIGATHARADTPDEYLDEREIATRNEVYLQAFRIVGALIALGFMVVTLLPKVPLDAKDVFTLLFPIVLFLPTCVLAWIQPDPISDLE